MVADVHAAMALGPAAAAAVAQTWEPFALVAGLLLIGVVAHGDGVFARIAGWLARTPGGELPLYAVSMVAVATTTALLNLDTSVAFLTPVLVQLARRRGAAEAPFVYGAVYMSNAASLILPGSNLTNLLVFGGQVPGAAFARDMAGGWAAAVLVTAALVWALFHRRRDAAVHAREPAPHATGWIGWAAVAAATICILALPQPALPVLGIGGVIAAIGYGRRAVPAAELIRAVNPAVLGGLFVLACALGVVARVWSGPGSLMQSANPWQTAGLAAAASVLVNNLPAAVLLSGGGLHHVRSLLVGLNLGPNLAVTGSLSAVIWLQVTRSAGAERSARRYSAAGLVLVPCSIAAALAVLSVTGSPRL